MTLSSLDHLLCFSPGSAPRTILDPLLRTMYWSLRESGGELVDDKGQIQSTSIKTTKVQVLLSIIFRLKNSNFCFS